MDCSPPASSVHGFSRQQYWSGLPFPPPGDLLDPGIKAASLTFPALAGGFFTTSATWEVTHQNFPKRPMKVHVPRHCSPHMVHEGIKDYSQRSSLHLPNRSHCRSPSWERIQSLISNLVPPPLSTSLLL